MNHMKTALAVLAVGVFLVASFAYTAFQWGECRKDPDHTYWHCVQVVGS